MNEKTRAISDCFATPVTWSPDGRKIAYLSGCEQQGSSSEIWLLDLTHPVPIRLSRGWGNYNIAMVTFANFVS